MKLSSMNEFRDVPPEQLKKAVDTAYARLPFFIRYLLKPLWVYIAAVVALGCAFLAPHLAKLLNKPVFMVRIASFFIGGSLGAALGAKVKQILAVALLKGRIRKILDSEETK